LWFFGQTILEGMVLLYEHRTTIETQSARLHHIVDHLDWERDDHAGLFGVTAAEAAA
jgi:hypothetical protein